MKFLLPLLSAVSLLNEQQILDFQAWVTEHGKLYSGSTEFLYRADIYHQNLQLLRALLSLCRYLLGQCGVEHWEQILFLG